MLHGRRSFAVPRESSPAGLAVRLPVDDVVLDGDLRIPTAATGLVIFAHGSGSSRHSPRNRSVARYFNGRSLATLLLDLLIVGGEDHQVLGLNELAMAKLACTAQLVTVEGATHLFEESGTLEDVARLAADWFGQHFARRIEDHRGPT